MKKALIVIDIQNDYFPNGKFPLWNTQETLNNIKKFIDIAKEKDIKIIFVQHIANPEKGIAPFFNKDSYGSEIHPELLTISSNYDIIIKEFADSFEKTSLDSLLIENNIKEIFVCGMMTQNCVTHTAISKSAEKYNVSVLLDCCTTVDPMIHNIALNAVSTRVKLISYKDI